MSLPEPQTDAGVVAALEAQLGTSWPALREGRRLTAEKRGQLTRALENLATEDTSIVVFGSLARDEFTSESDIDWTLLVDGATDPRHLDVAAEIEGHVRQIEQRPPGREGTFGGLTSSHELIHTIGGGDDTNRNMTLRILMLLESATIGRREAYERVLRNILKRYIDEDYGLLHGRSPSNVPRFLQNDIARYWRTVAVDFAYKQRTRSSEKWAVKTAKLRVSRKLTYAAGLLMCFGYELDPEHRTGAGQVDALSVRIQEHLSDASQATPLDTLAAHFLARPRAGDVARELFNTYDRFLGLLADPEVRGHLEKLPREQADSDARYTLVRETSHSFQNALDRLFFDGGEMERLTKIYGVF